MEGERIVLSSREQGVRKKYVLNEVNLRFGYSDGYGLLSALQVRTRTEV